MKTKPNFTQDYIRFKLKHLKFITKIMNNEKYCLVKKGKTHLKQMCMG